MPDPTGPAASTGSTDAAGLDGISIRPARPRDATSFLEIYRAVAAERRFIMAEEVRHPPRHYRRRFRRSWTEEEAFLVAVSGPDVVGFLSIRRNDHPVTRHVATLGMAVRADRRGKGIGSRLLAEAMSWGRSVGVERIELTVYPHNEAAIALYGKFGFEEEGRLRRHSRKSYGYEDEILMATWLGEEQAE